MKYTRYDYNKKRKSNFGLSLIIVIVLGTLIGAGVFKLSGNGMNNLINNNKQVSENKGGDTAETNGEISEKCYVAIQCGVYKNQENANSVIASIPSDFQSFMVEEDGKYRIIAGIFEKSEVETKVNELNTASINNFSIKYNINEKDNNGLIISEIINGYLQIVNKVSESEIQSVNTSEFKEWVRNISGNSENETVKEMVNMTNNLPDEYKKENNVEVMKTLYKLLSKYKI